MPDPVAWTIVERGWAVTASDGNEVGKVNEVLGDPEADIFDGVEVSHGLLEKTEYVPSECVVAIRQGEVVVRRA